MGPVPPEPITRHRADPRHTGVDVELAELRAVRALVRTGSVSAAAAELGLTAPTLRRRLARLARRTGIDPRAGRSPHEDLIAVLTEIERSLGRQHPALAGKRSHVRFVDLRVLRAIGCFDSMNRAAAALHLTQSTTTRIVQRLEHLVGEELVRRDRRGATLTPAGARIASVVEDVDRWLAGVVEQHGSVLDRREPARGFRTSRMDAVRRSSEAGVPRKS